MKTTEPNQPLERNGYVRHASCVARVAPAITPAQIAMIQFMGGRLPMVRTASVCERVRAGRSFLLQIAGQDLGFDPAVWHAHLRATGAGGYRWSNQHLGMPKRIQKATGDPEWRQCIETLKQGAQPG